MKKYLFLSAIFLVFYSFSLKGQSTKVEMGISWINISEKLPNGLEYGAHNYTSYFSSVYLKYTIRTNHKARLRLRNINYENHVNLGESGYFYERTGFEFALGYEYVAFRKKYFDIYTGLEARNVNTATTGQSGNDTFPFITPIEYTRNDKGFAVPIGVRFYIIENIVFSIETLPAWSYITHKDKISGRVDRDTEGFINWISILGLSIAI